MMDWLFPFTHWHWWTIALLLMAGELVLPGVFLFWEGLAAVVVGLIMLAVPDLGWKAQLVWFSVTSAILVMTQVYLRSRRPPQTDETTLNRRAQQYVGRTATVIESVDDTGGAVRLDDTRWKARGPVAEPGTQVVVTGVEGTTLIVAPVTEAQHTS